MKLQEAAVMAEVQRIRKDSSAHNVKVEDKLERIAVAMERIVATMRWSGHADDAPWND